jgi:hypothetical protein
MGARPVTRAADRRAPMPSDLETRIDHIDRAQASLADETRRLERIGFEDPLRRCHEERRYWNFLAAVHAMAAPVEPEMNFESTQRSHGRYA